MSGWDPACLDLIRAMARTARGPRREGVYALWLTLRVAEDLLDSPPPGERAHRRRLAALEHRVATLTLPAPLRRGLAAALSQLRAPKPESAVEALSLLTAPAREVAGPEAGDAIAAAARTARERVKTLRSVYREGSAS